MKICERCNLKLTIKKVCQYCAASLRNKRTQHGEKIDAQACERALEVRRKSHQMAEQHRRSEIHTQQPSLPRVRWLERAEPE